jgi:hypothetical protein
MPHEELILAFPGGARRDKVPSVTHTKGQWIVSSVRGLREGGHIDAYLAQLPAKYHRIVLESGVAEWHPIDVVLEHYAACERLDLDTNEIVRIGRLAAERAQGTVIGVTSRLVTNGGMTPWTFIPMFQRFWDRMMRGGGVSAWKIGPKEARVEVVGFPPSRYRYTRLGMCGVVERAISLLCSKVYVTELPTFGTPDDVVMRAAWV